MVNKKRYYALRSSPDPKKVNLVEITEEQYQAIYPEIRATIKREQRHGRCRCPANYLWTCNGYCSDCSYHTGGNEESIDELTETELSNDKPLMDELMACNQMLKLLVARSGNREGVKFLPENYGASKLSAIEQNDYAALLKNVEGLKNA